MERNGRDCHACIVAPDWQFGTVDVTNREADSCGSRVEQLIQGGNHEVVNGNQLFGRIQRSSRPGRRA